MSRPGKTSIKIVADTNTLVSALIGKRLRSFIESHKQGRFELCFSTKTFSELLQVLERPRLQKYYSIKHKEDFLKALARNSTVVDPKNEIQMCRDPKDNQFLECAVEAEVDYLVTGDQDLLILDPFEGIEIIPPSQFLERIS